MKLFFHFALKHIFKRISKIFQDFQDSRDFKIFQRIQRDCQILLQIPESLKDFNYFSEF